MRPELRDVALAVAAALANGAWGTEIRRVVELVITLPVVMDAGDISDEIKKIGTEDDSQ